MRCYIAGPLFTQGDRWYLEKIDEILKRYGISTYLPHRDAGLCPSNTNSTNYYFTTDKENVYDCDFMIAVLHGTDIDSGTAWEIGCAYALNKPIFSVAEDIRIAERVENINLMISNSTKVHYNLQELEKSIKEFVNNAR